MAVPTYKFSNLDLFQIWDAISNGAGGSDATAANQVLQIAQETLINTKLQSIVDEQSALGVATGLSGTGTIIIPNANKFFTNLFIQAPDNLSGSTFKIEVSATSGTANFREVGTINTNNQFFEYSGYFGQIRLTRLTGAATTLNWYTTNRPKGDATAALQTEISTKLSDIESVVSGIETQVNEINQNLSRDYNGSRESAIFSGATMADLKTNIDSFIQNLDNDKIIGISITHSVGTFHAIILYID